ncbi:hypothetical protein [Nocardia alba]|uniref:Uncharacterized protein n=1 Tax=Nocardia alba TaxID=225051 RepID=A0A4R1F6B8_9NOCA|nr:hypothetical protein [Nocardia alba]TCJ88122.1 hypothetical protein DFR71_6664 [Nocardia alba]
MLVVNQVEVRSIHGCVTLRVSDIDGDPVSIALPGEAVLDNLTTFAEAARDAEEQYWQRVVPYVKSLNLTGPEDAAHAMSRWHRLQQWERAAKHAPPQDVMFLLTNAGHVGIGVNPPASLQPVLAIIDPLQLRRISPGMTSAAHQALQEAGSSPWPTRALAAHESLVGEPWRKPQGSHEPSLEEATEYMMGQYTDFLRRSPFVRSPEHELPL